MHPYIETLKQEVTLKGNTDIVLSISEPTTGKKHESIPIRVNLRAAFTKYNILPARGMNFGPLVYNTTSNPRAFEIANTGEFAFDYDLFNYGAAGASSEAEGEEGAEGEEPKAKEPPPPVGDTLELGNFSISPAQGTIEPGEKTTLEVRRWKLITCCEPMLSLIAFNC